MAQFGELLAELRRDAGLKQSELAEKLYVTAGTISNYENNVHLPDVEKLEAIADLFHVTTDYLLGRCSSDLSPDIWDHPLLAGKTTSEVVRTISSLTPERRHALAVILRDMSTRMILEQYGEGSK